MDNKPRLGDKVAIIINSYTPSGSHCGSMCEIHTVEVSKVATFDSDHPFEVFTDGGESLLVKPTGDESIPWVARKIKGGGLCTRHLSLVK